MIVAWDEEFASVKLYHDIKDVGVKPYEVIPIEDLLDAWEKQKAEQTEPQITMDCSKCRLFTDGGEECDLCALGIIDVPQTETDCNKCLGELCAFSECPIETEPQTDCAWK